MNMNPIQIDAVTEAIGKFGSQVALARALEVTSVTVGQWINPDTRIGRPVPPKRCVRIEQLAGVSRRRTRPDDWQEIWPELMPPSVNPCDVATESVALEG